MINDPLSQPTVPAGRDCCFVLKFWDGRALCVKIVITTGTVVGLVDQYFLTVFILRYFNQEEIFYQKVVLNAFLVFLAMLQCFLRND